MLMPQRRLCSWSSEQNAPGWRRRTCAGDGVTLGTLGTGDLSASGAHKAERRWMDPAVSAMGISVLCCPSQHLGGKGTDPALRDRMEPVTSLAPHPCHACGWQRCRTVVPLASPKCPPALMGWQHRRKRSHPWAISFGFFIVSVMAFKKTARTFSSHAIRSAVTRGTGL